MEKQCFDCGSPMKLIPSGVSKKTGNPYKAFWSCACGKTAPAEPKGQPQASGNTLLIDELQAIKQAINQKFLDLDVRLDGLAEHIVMIEKILNIKRPIENEDEDVR